MVLHKRTTLICSREPRRHLHKQRRHGPVCGLVRTLSLVLPADIALKCCARIRAAFYLLLCVQEIPRAITRGQREALRFSASSFLNSSRHTFTGLCGSDHGRHVSFACSTLNDGCTFASIGLAFGLSKHSVHEDGGSHFFQHGWQGPFNRVQGHSFGGLPFILPVTFCSFCCRIHH